MLAADSERRHQARLHPSLPLYADYAGRCRRVYDLSPSGVFIEDGACLPSGSPVTVSLWLNEYNVVQLQARVRRAEKGRGMGLQFTEVNESQQEDLHRYLHQLHLAA